MTVNNYIAKEKTFRYEIKAFSYFIKSGEYVFGTLEEMMETWLDNDESLQREYVDMQFVIDKGYLEGIVIFKVYEND